MTHRIQALAPRDAASPRIEHDPQVVSGFLSDAAHVPGGFATGVMFPNDESEVAAAVSRAVRVLPVGAQSSLTGGATPRGEVVLSTRNLTSFAIIDRHHVRAGAGVPLSELQRRLSEAGLYYPPVPTYDGAYVGGTISTNAAGAATFKYGSTRAWVDALTVVLASGAVLEVERGRVSASADGQFVIRLPSGAPAQVRIPQYVMPRVPKLSAGYFARPGMDLIDLFIGSEGTLGVITAATLRVIERPARCVALVACRDDHQAVALTAALRDDAHASWSGGGGVDVSAIEYIDARALQVMPDTAFAKARVTRPADGCAVLLVQIEVIDAADATLGRLIEILDAAGVEQDPLVAPPGDERGAQRLFDFREAVPASVNARVAAAKEQTDPGIEKTAGDLIVPFEHLEQSLRIYREVFGRRGIEYAIWGHVSDGNLHVNVVPRTMADVTGGREAIIEMAHEVIALGGSPLAEHGVGRSAMKQRLLRELYGDDGIEQMRAVKRALDPAWKLSPGVLFPAPGEQ